MTEFLIATALFMITDYVTGFAGALKTGTVMSGKMREGLWHKGGFVGLVLLTMLLTYMAAHVPPEGIDVPGFVELCTFVSSGSLVYMVCAYIVITELVSNIENLCVLNPAIADSPLGKWLAEHGEKPVEGGNNA